MVYSEGVTLYSLENFTSKKMLNMVKFLFSDFSIEWIKPVFTPNMINVLLPLIKFTFIDRAVIRKILP